MKKFLSIIIIYSVFFSCKHDLENPTWDVDMIVPIKMKLILMILLRWVIIKLTQIILMKI